MFKTDTKGNAFGSTARVWDGGSSTPGRSEHAMMFGLFGSPPEIISTSTSPLPVTTGTSTPTYCVWSEKDPSNPSIILQYQTITTMQAYRGASLEELRVEDYRRSRKTNDTSDRTSAGISAMLTTGLFPTPTPTTTEQPANDLVFGGSVSGKPQQRQPSALQEPKPASGSGLMLDPSKLECLEELARKVLLGEELSSTQFHLFSAKSLLSGRVMEPRVLCANNALLTKSSRYFMNLLSGDINPLDASLVDLMGDYAIPNDALISDYGYESDSDLDDCDSPGPTIDLEVSKERSALKDRDSDVLSNDSSDSVSLDMFFMSLEQPGEDVPFGVDKGCNGSAAGSESVVRETGGNNGLDQRVTQPSSFGTRHILIRDTAFQTWYTLLNYLYTGKINFLPLSSIRSDRQRGSSTTSLHVPSCSAKSMYRLASKVGFDDLRDEAFSHIRSNLTEHNILKELSCSIVSKYPQLLEMELDVLYSLHIASPPVVANFAALAHRLVRGELSHGADLIIGIYTRLLKEHRPRALQPAFPFPTLVSASSDRPESIKANLTASDVSQVEAKHKAGSSHLDRRGTQQESSLSGSGANGSTSSMPPRRKPVVRLPGQRSLKDQM